MQSRPYTGSSDTCVEEGMVYCIFFIVLFNFYFRFVTCFHAIGTKHQSVFAYGYDTFGGVAFVASGYGTVAAVTG